MAVIDSFDSESLRAICNILGDTTEGLTGTEIGQLLESCGIDDPMPGTKRYRLYEALAQRQAQDRCGNNVAAFINAAMNPVRYTRESELFEQRRSELNVVLAFCGFQIGEDGRLRPVEASKTLSRAQERANQLQRELLVRKVHPDVLRFCRAELLQDNYFHAVFEATKSVANSSTDDRQEEGGIR